MAFAVNGRIGRLRYLAYCLAMYFIVSVGLGLLMIPMATLGKKPNVVVYLPISITAVMLVLYVFIARRRRHDLDIGGWFVLCMFVPFVNLYFGLIMLFKQGDEGGNEYGAKPSPNTWGVKVIAIVLPLIAVIGMVAAIAIPRMR